MSLLDVHLSGPDDGRPVLALHGVTGHRFRWRVLAAELPGGRLVAVDLRGHGRSPLAPPWSLEQHVPDALDTLDHLGLDRLPVIGHSFGGAVALLHARRRHGVERDGAARDPAARDRAGVRHGPHGLPGTAGRGGGGDPGLPPMSPA